MMLRRSDRPVPTRPRTVLAATVLASLLAGCARLPAPATAGVITASADAACPAAEPAVSGSSAVVPMSRRRVTPAPACAAALPAQTAPLPVLTAAAAWPVLLRP